MSLDGRAVRFVCHMAQLSGTYRRNSLAAIRECFDAGAERIEIDIHSLAGGDYIVFHDRRLDEHTTGSGSIGKATADDVRALRWRDDPCELQELAIAEERQGQGLGKQFVAWLIAEARRHSKRQMLVGTANSSIDNIAFYQKCGFRMDHVRQDYFRYYREPIYENGIQTRDMLVFRFDL